MHGSWQGLSSGPADPCMAFIHCKSTVSLLANFLSGLHTQSVASYSFIREALLPPEGLSTTSLQCYNMNSTVLLYCAITFTTLILLITSMSFLRSKNHFQVNNRTIIITGGSQGFGLSLAQQLSSKGANIVIVAQSIPKLESALASIQTHAQSPNQRFLQLSYDLRSPDSAPQILATVTKWNNGAPPDIVWNCAGHALPAFFADASVTTLRDQMETIYWSAAYVAHATLNLWKIPRCELPSPPPSDSTSTAPRHLIFTSSVLPFFPIAGYTPYTVPKSAMKTLSDSLRQEVAVYNGHASTNAPSSPATNIEVAIVFPMGIMSPGLEHENTLKPAVTKTLEEGDSPQHPNEVARIAIRKLERGEHSITTAPLGALMHGAGMGPTPRSGVVDVFWNFVGSLAVGFVAVDFLSKCRKWGREKAGMTGL